ncbi:MAG: MarR family winged helix-turn-helix transcriptional regulator [Phycisphaerae bacterium]
MPRFQEAQQLQEFAQELFEMSKDIWAAQNKARTNDQTELTETEFLTLDLLVNRQPQTVGDLQKQIGILPTQMSRVIRSLENKSEGPLIRCQINREDKRKVDVEVTEAGREAHQAYRQYKLGSIQRLLTGLSEQDRSELVRIVRLVRQQARKTLSEK